MTFYQLECFLAVSEELSFAKAAEQMCISQPAISYQINALEKELDSRLFERTTRSCRLTASGSAFRQDISRLMLYYRQAVQRVHDIDAAQKMNLNIGIRKFFDYKNLAAITNAFRLHYPDSDVQVVPHTWGAPLEDLRRGRIDVGFCYNCEHTEVADVAFWPLYSLSYYALMSPEHPLSKKKSLHFHDMKGYKVSLVGETGGPFSEFTESSGLTLTTCGADLSFQPAGFESSMVAVTSNYTILILPMLPVSQIPGMCKIPLMESPDITMELCWMKGDKRLSVSTLINLVTEQFNCKPISGAAANLQIPYQEHTSF